MSALRNFKNVIKIIKCSVSSAANVRTHNPFAVAAVAIRNTDLTEFETCAEKATPENYNLISNLDKLEEKLQVQRARYYAEKKRLSLRKFKTEENEDMSELPALPPLGDVSVPTFNLAAYVNKSPTLQQFIKLGVDLHSIEKRKGLAEFILKLDFEQNVKPYLTFLNDQGVPPDNFGKMITRNPLIFKEELANLQQRVDYLRTKLFDAQQRARILTKNPYWLMFPIVRIDRRLGIFQKDFLLNGDDVRFLATKQPRLIIYHMDRIKRATFSVREEMGFDADETKCLLLAKPKFWMMNPDLTVEVFSYAHNEMGLTHDCLLQNTGLLVSRLYRLKERHEFLKLLGRAQYDPQQDLYVQPSAIVVGDNEHFVREIAKSDMKTFELFLRTR